MHHPFENLSDRQIKKARAQAKSEVPVEKSCVTESDLEFHVNLVVHHVSPVSASMTESLYG